MSSIGSHAPEERHKDLLKAAADVREKRIHEILEASQWISLLDKAILRISLQRVVSKGHIALAKYLIQHGAELNPGSDGELSALHKACEIDAGTDGGRPKDKHADRARDQPSKGITSGRERRKNANKRHRAVGANDGAGHDAEHVAKEKVPYGGNVELVQLLLDHGAYVDVRDKAGRTALFNAACKGHTDVMKLLLHRGANINALDRGEKSVLVYLASEKKAPWNSDTVQLLIDHGIDLESRDRSTGRTVLLWAASLGKQDLVATLLRQPDGRRPELSAVNPRGRTSLQLAAEGGHEDIVRMLVECGADPTVTSDGNWTALHNAADKGYVGIVELLLRTRANVNAETSSGMTALHWAAQNGHASVVEALLKDPRTILNIKDSFDCTPMLRAAEKGYLDIVRMLAPPAYGPRLSSEARDACKGFEATIVDFGLPPSSRHSENTKGQLVTKRSVYDLLYGWDAEASKPLVHTMVRNIKSNPTFRWIHLPANNLAWMETLITKYFVEAGGREVDDFKALEKCFGQEHRGPMVHAHFMRHSCTRVSTHLRPNGMPKQTSAAELTEDNVKLDVKAGEKVQKDGTSTPKGETPNVKEKEREKGKEQLSGRAEKKKAKAEKQTKKGGKADANGGKDQKQGKGDDKFAHGALTPGRRKPKTGKLVLFMPYLHYETDSRRMRMSQTIKEALTGEPPTGHITLDDLLIRGYINSDPPLHARRTLDQFFYHGIDTTERDRDQVVFRYCQRRGLEPKLFMVDQLWIFILGEELILTSFPQRYHQPKQDPVNMLEGIIEDMNAKTRPPMRNVYDLAMLITTRCSGVFDRHRLDNQDFQFLDMFETSIGHVTNRESKLFSRFNRASAGAAQWLRNFRRSQRASAWSRALDTNPYDPGGREDLFQDSLLDIGTETELLAEIKDIRDEINIIKMVLQYQTSVLPELADFLFDELGGRKSLEALESRKKSKDQLKTIDVHIKDLERMDKQAESIYTSLTHLLDLKQKQANAFEARFAADRAISSARQGQTVMVFTIVTIIFLPMSFIASFFTIEITNFPQNPDGSSAMTLDFVSRYVFGIGFAISIPLVAMAFTVNDIGRSFKRIWQVLMHFTLRSRGGVARHRAVSSHEPRRSVHFDIDSHRDSFGGGKTFAAAETFELRRSIGFDSDRGSRSYYGDTVLPLKPVPFARTATGMPGFSRRSWETVTGSRDRARDIERL